MYRIICLHPHSPRWEYTRTLCTLGGIGINRLQSSYKCPGAIAGCIRLWTHVLLLYLLSIGGARMDAQYTPCKWGFVVQGRERREDSPCFFDDSNLRFVVDGAPRVVSYSAISIAWLFMIRLVD